MDDCVTSRTGYVIVVANSHIIWQCKLQSVTTLFTMDANIVALAHSWHKLFPIMDGVSIMGIAITLPWKYHNLRFDQ